MLLCSPNDVVSALGIGASEAVLGNILPAIRVASETICRLIDTNFLYQKQFDIFQNKGRRYRTDTSTPQLRLTNSYVNLGTVEVRYSADGLPLRSNTQGVLLTADDYMVNPQTGVITLLANIEPYAPVFYGISVTYESGFEANGADERAPLNELPGWVGQAAVALSAYTHKILPINTSQRSASAKGAKVGAMEKEVSRLAASLVNSYIRPRVNLQFPEMTQVLDA